MNELKNNLPRGLCQSEVQISRRRYGQNIIESKKRDSFFKQYLSAFGDPIIKIMLIALGVNFVMMFKTADWFESVGIALAVFIATLVSTISEYGSESAFIKLQQNAEQITSRVIRSGNFSVVPSSELVVGDIISLQSGEKIPADGIIISGSILTDQSSLTGESREIKKIPSSDDFSCPDPNSKHQLFSNCTVTSGEALMRICAVGENTLYGKTASSLRDKSRQSSPLKERLAKLADSISRLGYIAAVFVACADLFNAFVVSNSFNSARILASFSDIHLVIAHLLHAITLAITVIVVAVPEGLPMMITVVLSSNMMKMIRDKVLVRKLIGIETAGSLNILFTDKTGTLTKGQLEPICFIDARGHEYGSLHEIKKNPELYNFIRLSAVFNSGSAFDRKKVFGGNATDRALLSYIPYHDRAFKNIKKADYLPFDSGNKFSWAEIYGDYNMIMIKGAPEKILERCDFYYDRSFAKSRFSSKTMLYELLEQKTSDSCRVIALACSERAGFNKSAPLSCSSLTLVGLFCLRDQLRPEAARAVSEIKSAGIQTVMITGDGKQTASAIARACGILDHDGKGAVLCGNELSKMSDAQIAEKIPDLRVVARSLPSDKLRLVNIAQNLGLVVGMTGDGINDAPALKHADVGFSMGAGTEAAKQASDIIIIDNNIGSIQKAILYGRTIFKSIRKFITFQLTMNMCAVGVSIIGPFIGIESPVTVIQMLWINMIMDALGGLAFSGEAARPEYMRQPPKSRNEPILSSDMLLHILYMGTFTTFICILFLRLDFIRDFFRYAQNPIYLMTGFFALFIFCGIFNSFNARSDGTSILSGLRKNPRFVFIMGAVCCVQLVIIYHGGSLFRTTGLSLGELCFVISMALCVIPSDMLFKKFFLFGKKRYSSHITSDNIAKTHRFNTPLYHENAANQ